MKTSKSIIFAVVLLAALPLCSTAQISVGTRQGFSVSTLSKIGDLYDNVDLTTSYTGGVFALVPVKGNFTFQPELNYIRKGRNSGTSLTANSEESKCLFNYVQVPLLARYTMPAAGGNSCRYFLNAGPYASALLNTSIKLIDGSELNDDKVTDNHSHTDIGLIFGGGLEFPVNKAKLSFDIRYDMGLTNLNDQPDGYRTKSVSVAAGIRF